MEICDMMVTVCSKLVPCESIKTDSLVLHVRCIIVHTVHVQVHII